MTDKKVKPSAKAGARFRARGEDVSCGHSTDATGVAVASNAVVAALGTLYTSTGSVQVTAIAAGAVALVAVCLLVRRWVVSSANARKID